MHTMTVSYIVDVMSRITITVSYIVGVMSRISGV